MTATQIILTGDVIDGPMTKLPMTASDIVRELLHAHRIIGLLPRHPDDPLPEPHATRRRRDPDLNLLKLPPAQ